MKKFLFSLVMMAVSFTSFRMVDDSAAAPLPDTTDAAGADSVVVPDAGVVVPDASEPAAAPVASAENHDLLTRIEAALATGEQWVIDNITAVVDAVEKSL